ncbi:DUF6339 family protein [Streptomyces sp. TLI_105]|uniref:DUF6339 family protein n=1 Tax=Streptomyces sp. TLI_105 TaxID=1881019 RepID=UPI0008993300|nr:DUF6339 family protein [Streptomyces sp. TLI_105]SED29562.1 hypothetical protein SAMN05428939_4797 [Streptomyces sp. TLI_105]
MSLLAPVDQPQVFALLPDAAVTKHLTRGIQSGLELPPQVALARACVAYDAETAGRRRTAPVRELLDEAMRRFTDDRSAADGWLAPRIHATLRMTRAEAADSRLWNHLAMIVAPDYVVWRHKGVDSADGRGIAPAARFSGIHYTQAFSRLWWAAELFRDGHDYAPVVTACRLQDILNTTLRLDVIDHRPTAQAMIRVIGDFLDAGVTRPADHVNAFSAAVNAAGSTLMYDVLAEDVDPDTDELFEWIEAGVGEAVDWDWLPEGPHDGRVRAAAVDALLPLFEKLRVEAPLRQRKRAEGVEDADATVPGPRASGVVLSKPSDFG